MKGIEVYERLVKQDDRDPPDLVISGECRIVSHSLRPPIELCFVWTRSGRGGSRAVGQA